MDHLKDTSPHIQAEATPGATKGADPSDANELPTHASGADAPTGKCPSRLSPCRLSPTLNRMAPADFEAAFLRHR